MTSQTRHQPRVKVCYNSHLILTTMARLQGISGGMSGRTGSFTYRQSRGQTIVSQYQPVVKNPNTAAQQSQRAKFKLMSQLASILAPAFGSFIIITRGDKLKQTQRNAFVSKNMQFVQTSTDETTADVVAKINMEKVQLTSSNRDFGLLSLSADPENNSVTATITIGAGSEVTKGRLVLVGYGTMGVTKRPAVRAMRDVPLVEGANTVTFENLPADDYTLLTYGLIPQTASAATKIDINNIHTPLDEEFVSAVDLNAMVSDGLLVETATMGANVTLDQI